MSDENLNTTAFFLLPPESACIPGIPEQLLLERVRVVMDVLVSYHRKEGRKEGRKEWMHACICRSESSGVWALAAVMLSYPPTGVMPMFGDYFVSFLVSGNSCVPSDGMCSRTHFSGWSLLLVSER